MLSPDVDPITHYYPNNATQFLDISFRLAVSEYHRVVADLEKTQELASTRDALSSLFASSRTPIRLAESVCRRLKETHMTYSVCAGALRQPAENPTLETVDA